MSRLRLQRGSIRGSFTRAYNELTEEINKQNEADNSTLKLLWKRVEDRFGQLSKIDEEIIHELRQHEFTPEEMDEEVNTAQEYRDKWNDLSCVIYESNKPEESTSSRGTDGKTRYKLPKLTLVQFDGNPKEWLTFWSQFKSIHEDKKLSAEEKFQYLIQTTVMGSVARTVVSSFPPTAENYSKAVEYLKSRFGRDKVLVEVYVRELLKLVLTNRKEEILLSSLYDQLETQLRALESLGVTSDKYASMLYPLVESALSDDVLRTWERSRNQRVESTQGEEEQLSQLMNFLRKEVESEIRLKMAKHSLNYEEESSNYPPKKQQRMNSGNITTMDLFNKGKEVECIFCSKIHLSQDCFAAKKMTLKERFSRIREAGKCFKCLKGNHIARTCRLSINCPVCNSKHYLLMCSKAGDNKKSINEINAVSTYYGFGGIILQTLLVLVKGPNMKQSVRVLIDTGSERSYITKKAVEKFGLEVIGTVEIAHCLFGGQVTKLRKHMVHRVEVSNITGISKYHWQLLDVEKICGSISPIPKGPWIKELDLINITLSDNTLEQYEIHILIGADIASTLYTGKIQQTKYGPTAFETVLGWTLMGKCDGGASSINNVLLVHSLYISDATIQDLWKLDLIGIHDSTETKSREELSESALVHFKGNVRRLEDGRYEVSLPWIQHHPPVSDNHLLADKRIRYTVDKLKKAGKMHSYQEVFDDWEESGIIEEVPYEEYNYSNVSYLPHRPVFNQKSTTTPIRPVFDASAKSKGRPSLNDCLEKGPNLIELIPTVLTRFRMKQYGVISDLKKAFLQISVKQEDRDYLRFLWYKDQKLQIYRHCRVVFGVKSSPFLLAAILNHHLDNADEILQETAQVLKKSLYVDNCIVSMDSQQEIQKFIKESVKICAEARFELRGWAWNRGEIITGDVARVSSSECGLGTGSNISQETSQTSVLGYLWDMNKDNISLDLTKMLETRLEDVTKRVILAATHRIYDPIGFTAPVKIIPKILLQEVCKKKLKWDTPVPAEIERKFKAWMDSIQILTTIEIPRWILKSGSTNKSIHIFTDASKRAYTAIAFLRSENYDGIYVQLILAKSRVATIKPITIPKLELVGCECGAKLVANIKTMIDVTDTKWYLWTDSGNALSWIKRKENWQTFVYNRVKKINELTNSDDWRHISGNLNPADLPSRGCSSKQLLESRWWEGPAWLKKPEEDWPQSEINCEEDVVMAEKKKIVVSHIAHELESTRYFRLFSNLRKIIRMIAWMRRWKIYKRNKEPEGELKAEEEREAEYCLWRMIQNEQFNTSQKVIHQLNAIKDERGIWRVKTKLLMRKDSEGFRMPILLPKEHISVERLIRREHLEMSHCGVQVLRNVLRERFWVIGARITVRRVVKSCGRCRRFGSKKFTAPEAPLPLNRVRDAAVFEVIGIDLGGPLYLIDEGKTWFVVFTCAVYRAVHLELVTSLSTEGFIQALRRFVARRGRPEVIYTDNGTNFSGTDNLMDKLNWEEIKAESTARRIKWIFNPPSAPWWGGWWERIVAMVKQWLRRNLGRTILDYEEMITILCDCEQIINLRPLTYLSEDSDELIPLTPMMFLNEARSQEVIDLDHMETIMLKGKYEYRQRLREQLRDRFRKEYLSLLVHTNIRKSKYNNIHIGDVVIVELENKKRIDWPMAKVIELFPGIDDVVRSVKVKTKEGYLDRPIQKLYLLEAHTDDWMESNKMENRDTIIGKHLSEPVRQEKTSEQLMVGEEYSREARSETKESEQSMVSEDLTGTMPVVAVTRYGRKVHVPKRFMN